jgi:hypothetical protein
LVPRGEIGGADGHGAQMDIAFAGAPTLLLAGALVVAGTHAGSCGEMWTLRTTPISTPILRDGGGDRPVDAGSASVGRAERSKVPCFDAVVEGAPSPRSKARRP